MKRILAFSFFPAFVPPSNGGEARLFGLYAGLSRTHHVTLLSSTHQDVAEETIRHGANFFERRIPKDSSFSTAWNVLSSASSGGDLSAPCILYSGSTPNKLHDAYLEEYREADVIIHDSPFTLPCDLFFGLDDKPRIYNAYNCESKLYRTLHPETRSKPIWDLIESAEKRLLLGSDCVFYCSTDDLRAFEDLAPDAHYSGFFVPNGFTPGFEQGVRKATPSRITNIVFMGSAHPPNVHAATKVASEFASALPECTFHLIGNCLPEGEYPENVVRHGFISETEKNKVLEHADLAVNPMELGSGSNLKVFEYLAKGIPLLTTSFGIRGVEATHSVDCLIADCDEFPGVIRNWSRRQEDLTNIGLNGRRLANQHYRWEAISARAAEFLEQIESRSRWQEPYVLVLNDYDSYRNTGGGGVRTRGLYAAVNEWAPVVFLCFSDTNEFQVRDENSHTVVFGIPKTEEHWAELHDSRKEHIISIDDIIAHRHCRSNRFLVAIYNQLKKRARSIVTEHPYLAALPITHSDQFVYSSQNNESHMKGELLKQHPRFEQLVEEVRVVERAAVQCSTAVIAVSEADAELFTENVRSVGPVIVVPNGGAEPATPTPKEKSLVKEATTDSTAVVFVGSAHMPNIDAAKYIIDCLAPEFPGVQFHLIGSVCNAFSSIDASNVTSWGTLTDSMKSAVMQACNVAINPTLSGGGSNIKLADYLANGLFVLTTPFGMRGYPEETGEHVMVAELDDFESRLESALSMVRHQSDRAADARKQFFRDRLSMKAIGGRFVDQLRSLERTKKKVLFVTYRYTHPILGGAESMFAHLIEAMDQTNDYAIDVVSAEISSMRNAHRFSEEYAFDNKTRAQVGLANTRFARFPVAPEGLCKRRIAQAWDVQPLFEKALFRNLRNHFKAEGLAWGWGDAETSKSHSTARWAFTSSGLYLKDAGRVRIDGVAPVFAAIRIETENGQLIRNVCVENQFELDFTAPAGPLEISTSAPEVDPSDPRPLAFLMTRLEINGAKFDLEQPRLLDSVGVADSEKFEALDRACEATRAMHSVRLTDLRGPFCPEMDMFLQRNTGKYDLVVTHNTIFRPAVAAIEQANRAGVPVVVIPHAHLDDDFYHFPDVVECAVNSDLVLAAPKSCCDFYRKKGANVSYLPAGIDTDEEFSANDVASFDSVCSVDTPFVLVLGRKAGAKGYQQVIRAIENLARDIGIHLVMIGPDDDQLPVQSRHATYLGQQPRNVVRGALMRCRTVVNMSASESFGIVLLEAWMANKPVVVNRNCPAFHDLATNEENALMVEGREQLEIALSRLWQDADLRKNLGANGNERAQDFNWAKIGAEFVSACGSLMKCSKQPESR